MRKPCQCPEKAVLPKGLLCDRGYLLIRLCSQEILAQNNGKPFLEGCGFHDSQTQKLATIKLNDYLKKIYLKQFDLKKEAPSLPLNKVLDIYEQHCEIKNKAGVIGVFNRQFRPAYGKMDYDKISPAMASIWRDRREKEFVDKERKIPVKFSTVNREQTAIQSVYSTVESWVKLEKDFMPRIKLPPENPFKWVTKPSEKDLARERVPNKQEKREAQEWCEKHDPELWEAVVRCTITMLRKKDFKLVNDTGATEGQQAKTGRRFTVRASFPSPVNLTNWRRRWEALQRAMGWTERLGDGSTNPRHTVWHDLRHWAGTILADNGFTGKQIQKAFNHASESMSDRYTHLSAEKLAAACQVVETFMRSKAA